MPTVRSCCCGCSLRTGTLIILWIGVIFPALGIIFGIANVFQPKVTFAQVLPGLLIYGFFMGIHIMGIYGVNKERPGYLKPYMALLVVFIVLMIISMLITLFFGPAVLNIASRGLSGSDADAFANAGASFIIFVVLFDLLVIGLIYYIFVVVLSFYKELKGGNPHY